MLPNAKMIYLIHRCVTRWTKSSEINPIWSFRMKATILNSCAGFPVSARLFVNGGEAHQFLLLKSQMRSSPFTKPPRVRIKQSGHRQLKTKWYHCLKIKHGRWCHAQKRQTFWRTNRCSKSKIRSHRLAIKRSRSWPV